MSNDKIEKAGRSLIQHGKASDRIYLMKLDKGDLPGLISKLEDLAEKNSYGKIFAKIPENASEVFLENGYVKEAAIPGFYKGEETGVFLGKFLKEKRARDERSDLIKEVLRVSAEKAGEKREEKGNDLTYTVRQATPADIAEMGSIYGEVFRSYPFPIHDTQYLLDTMKSHVKYYAACKGEGLVAVSSAEMDRNSKNAEMTDFATLPEFRKKGLAGRLLSFMDESMRDEGMRTVYTIARAVSFGMNITFAKNGYDYAGTLVNNTNIAGSIESMNVWYKRLG
jgi:putative beta-lysine N-acetyltransferase